MLLKIFLNKRVSFLLILLFIIFLSFYFYLKLPTFLYPSFNKPEINLNFFYSQINRDIFYKKYGSDFSSLLKSIKGAKDVTSSYSERSARYVISFDYGVDVEFAKTEVEKQILSSASKLKEDNVSYYLSDYSQNSPTYFFLLNSSSLNSEELIELIESKLINKVKQIEGLESAYIERPFRESIEIKLNSNLINKYNLLASQVYNILKQSLEKESIGSLSLKGDFSRTAISLDYVNSEESVENIVIKEGERGSALLLKDIATFVYKRTPSNSLYRLNGKKSILFIVTPKINADIAKFGTTLDKVIEEQKKENPLLREINFNKFIDPGSFINNALFNVLSSGFLGAFFAILVVLLFLGDFKNIFLVSLSIPLSLFLAVPLIYFKGITVNLISLGGMALALGMVVDASVVVMENINRLKSLEKNSSLVNLILKAVSEVRFALIASVLTSICVFLPLSTTAPMVNAILGDLSFIIIFTLLSSLFYALLINPFLAYYFYKYVKFETKALNSFSSQLSNFISNSYELALKTLLNSKMFFKLFFVILVCLLFFSSIYFLPPLIKKELIARPISSKLIFLIQYEREYEKIEDLDELSYYYEQKLYSISNGTLNNVFAQGSLRAHDLLFILDFNSTNSAKTFLTKMDENFSSTKETFFYADYWSPTELSLPSFNDLKISFVGKDSKKVLTYMREAVDKINDSQLYKGAIRTFPRLSFQEEIVLIPRREVYIDSKSLDLNLIYKLIKLNSSRRLGTLELERPERTDKTLVVVENEIDINSYDALLNFKVPYKDNNIPLKHLFDFKIVPREGEIYDVNGERKYYITADLSYSSSSNQEREEAKIAAENLLKDLNFENSYSYTFENPQKELENTINSLIYSLLISLLLIFLIIVIQFNSVKFSLIMLFAIPLGLIGVFLGLYIFSSTISLNSLLGAILLGGIAVNNSILIVDFYIQIREREKTLLKRAAIIKSARLRIIPILITMLTTLFGMIPIALSLGDSANVIQPLGIAVSCGIFISTLFTLFLVPLLLDFISS